MKVKKSKVEGDDLKGYVPLIQKQAAYAALIIGGIIIFIGIYLLATKTISIGTATHYATAPISMNGFIPLILGAGLILYGFYKLRRKKT